MRNRLVKTVKINKMSHILANFLTFLKGIISNNH